MSDHLKVIVVLIVVGVILTAAGLYTTFDTTVIRIIDRDVVTPKEPVPTDGVQLTVHSLSETTDLYALRGEYPLFSDYPVLSDAITAYVTDMRQNFITTVTENDAAIRATAAEGSYVPIQYSFDIRWSPEQITTKTVSLVIHIDAFEGGANMHQQLHTFTYDVASGALMPLSAAFPGEADYLDRVSEYTRTVLSGELGVPLDDQMLLDGTTPTEEHFSNFTLTDDAITFYFPKYQVAAGVFGAQEVRLMRGAQ
jgi:hypothetical protein